METKHLLIISKKVVYSHTQRASSILLNIISGGEEGGESSCVQFFAVYERKTAMAERRMLVCVACMRWELIGA
jgi:hypothetical protein